MRRCVHDSLGMWVEEIGGDVDSTRSRLCPYTMMETVWKTICRSPVGDGAWEDAENGSGLSRTTEGID